MFLSLSHLFSFFLTSSLLQLPEGLQADPKRLAETLNVLCSQPRFAGDPRSHKAIDYFADELSKYGWSVERKYYWAYLPRQTFESLEILQESGNWQQLKLYEEGFKEDPLTLNEHVPPMHGLTAEGEAKGKVWYVGYGTKKEFEQLSRQFKSNFKGDIALMRYGAIYRGQKIANAEKFGFSGALLYTDEEDDGSVRGTTLPQGPFRPNSGIQRGSVFNGNGDALTPGYAATKNAPRIDPKESKGLVKIPSLPISSSNAKSIIKNHGKKLGNTGTEAILKIKQDKTLQKICNVIGTIKGDNALKQSESILLGAHRDAWGRGATDNGTGSTVLLETARLLGIRFQNGWKPRRTIIVASWDAEEWGLVGSTEWVEENKRALIESAVAYINLDVAATGPNLSATCTPGLSQVITEACKKMNLEPPARIGVPGGGSDHVPFIEIAGVEVAGFGFHGASGVYHSALDTPYLINHFLDPNYEFHSKATELAVNIMLLLSKKKAPVDGRAAWLRQMQRGLREHKNRDNISKNLFNELEESINQQLINLTTERAEQSFRFQRAFIPESGTSWLWNSSGYAGSWFPFLNDDESAKKLLKMIKKNNPREDK